MIMTDNADVRFVGFTREEWFKAFVLGGMPRNQAYTSADVMFARIEREGSNGGGVDDKTWALLAVANKSEGGLARVREELAEFPAILRRVERIIDELQGRG